MYYPIIYWCAGWPCIYNYNYYWEVVTHRQTDGDSLTDCAVSEARKWSTYNRYNVCCSVLQYDVLTCVKNQIDQKKERFTIYHFCNSIIDVQFLCSFICRRDTNQFWIWACLYIESNIINYNNLFVWK